MGNTRDSGLNNWLGVDVEFGTYGAGPWTFKLTSQRNNW